MRVGRFYNMLWMVVIIFATMFYIQLLSNINLPLQTSLEHNKVTVENGEEMLLHTTVAVKYDSETEEREQEILLSFKRKSSLVTQGILRSQYPFISNKILTNQTVFNNETLIRNTAFIRNNTLHNITADFRVLNNSSINIRIPDVIELNHNVSDIATEETLPVQIKENVLLNSNKVVSNDNDVPGNDKLGVGIEHIINNSVIIHSKLTYLHEQRISKNITKKEHQKLPNARKSRRPNYCPLLPGELVGHLQVDQLQNMTEIPEANRKLIRDGGLYKPPDCEPIVRTAIIIPYREREKHLMVLLRHLHTVLQRQKIEYGIYVVELAYPTQFNRGLLANVGFLTASSILPYTCFIIHDVDLLMTDDRNMYRCGRMPRHLTASNSKYLPKLPHPKYFGGVEAFTPEQYRKLNGFSNLFFGWGGEDTDMVYRIIYTNQYFTRPRQQIGGYVALEHGQDSGNPPNPHRFHLLRSARQRMETDGVRTVAYNRLSLEFKPLFTWIYIAAKETAIMEKYQAYLDDG